MNTYEYAIKNVWGQVKEHSGFVEYMPSAESEQGRYPDRKFFWGVALTVLPQWSNQYIDQVIHERKEAARKRNFPNPKKISISSGWLAQLQQHDYVSTGK